MFENGNGACDLMIFDDGLRVRDGHGISAYQHIMAQKARACVCFVMIVPLVEVRIGPMFLRASLGYVLPSPESPLWFQKD